MADLNGGTSLNPSDRYFYFSEKRISNESSVASFGCPTHVSVVLCLQQDPYLSCHSRRTLRKRLALQLEMGVGE